MRRLPVLAVVAIVIGAFIVVVKLASDGLTPSFMLLLGVLLIADGILRLLVHRTDGAGPTPMDERR